MNGESRAVGDGLGVTAIVTCFNEGAYIRAAVESILNQTRSDLIEELIVLDDGSQAETLAVLAQVETIDPRVRVVYGPGGARQAAQRNKGVKVNALRYWRVAIPVTVAFRRREPALTIELAGRDPVPGVHFAWVSNTSPWTYSNSRPLVTNPGCSFESGLGVFALTEMKLIPTIRVLLQLLAKRPKLDAPQLIRDDDVEYVRVTSMKAPSACHWSWPDWST